VGDPTSAAEDQQVRVGNWIHGRDNKELPMRVSTRQVRVDPIHEDHRSNERKPIILVLPIQSILGFLWDSGTDCFTCTATSGKIFLEVLTAQGNPKTRRSAVQIRMKRIHRLGETNCLYCLCKCLCASANVSGIVN
jgi:hypothetical protein